MVLAVVAGVLAAAYLWHWLDQREQAKQRPLLKALAERLHFEREPGQAQEDTFKTLHQGWLLSLGMRQNLMSGRMNCLRPTLHLDLGLALPQRFEAIPTAWGWEFGTSDQSRVFKTRNAALDLYFVWMCAREEQPRAQEVLGRNPAVQRALTALSEGSSAFVRIEKNQVSLIFARTPDEAALRGDMEALTALAKALSVAFAPVRDEVRRNA